MIRERRGEGDKDSGRRVREWGIGWRLRSGEWRTSKVGVGERETMGVLGEGIMEGRRVEWELVTD
jgi:hypothetical protein